MWKPAEKLPMTIVQRRTLMAWVYAKTSPQRIVLRARICLLAADGLPNRIIAQELKTSRPTVIKWRKRFKEHGPEGLAEDASHGPSSRALPAEKVRAIVETTLRTTPPEKARWSTRAMAQAMGVSSSTISRIWDSQGLQPHRMEGLNLLKDNWCFEKLMDVAGVFLDPPDQVFVLCLKEQSQIPILDLTQPGFQMKKGRSGIRNNIIDLIEALHRLEGTVVSSCYPRHRNVEFRKFLRQIDRHTTNDLEIHMILDSRGTHNHPEVKTWLENHPRFHCHISPVSSSWLDLVNRWFGEITRKRIQRGAFSSVSVLLSDIKKFFQTNKADPKPFIWTTLSSRNSSSGESLR